MMDVEFSVSFVPSVQNLKTLIVQMRLKCPHYLGVKV